MFSTVLYVVDDPANVDSLSTAIYMSTVTVTTVGYGTAPRWLGEGVGGTKFQFLKPGHGSMDALMFASQWGLPNFDRRLQIQRLSDKIKQQSLYMYCINQYMRVCYDVRMTKKIVCAIITQRRPPKVQQVVNLLFRSKVLFPSRCW